MDLVIGAGVSGIAYTNFIKHNCLLIEKESEIGGYCRTIKRNGFVWDYSGHFFHFQNPKIESILSKNIDLDTLNLVKKKTSILYNGTYIDFPFQKNIHQLSKKELIDCLYDLFSTKSFEDKTASFKDMLYSNFGKSIAEKFLIPYNEKLYACDLNILDKEAMGRFFPKASKEEIILNFRNANNVSYNQTFVYPKGGAIEYIRSLYANVEKKIELTLNEQLCNVDMKYHSIQTDKRTLQYDNLISTIPFPELLDKCGIEYDRSIFTCNKVLVFNLGFDRKGADTKSSWIYIPDPSTLFYRVGFYDNIMQTDRLSMYVEIGFPSYTTLEAPEYYLGRILKDLRKNKLINDEQLIDYQSVVMNPAYVHINQKSLEAVKYYKAKLAKSNIYSIGRYGSWTYCSIEDNILEAMKLAKELD